MQKCSVAFLIGYISFVENVPLCKYTSLTNWSGRGVGRTQIRPGQAEGGNLGQNVEIS